MSALTGALSLRAAILILLLAAGSEVYAQQLALAGCGGNCDPKLMALMQQILGSYSGPVGLSIASIIALFSDRKASAQARVTLPVAAIGIVLTLVFGVYTVLGARSASPSGTMKAADIAAAYGTWPTIIGAGLTTVLALLSHKSDKSS